MKITRLHILIVLAILLGLCTYFISGYLKRGNALDNAKSNVKALKEETQVWKNKKDQWESKALSAEGDLNTLKITHEKELEDIADEFDAKVKHLKNVIRSRSTTEITTDIQPDSVREVRGIGLSDINVKLSNRVYFHDFNKWYRISGYADPGNVNVNLQVYDSLSYATIYRRDKWFKPKSLYIETKSYNPYTKITNTESIVVNESKAGRFGIGPQIGIGVSSDLQPTLFIGAGLQWNLIRF